MFIRLKSRLKSAVDAVFPAHMRAPAAGCLAASLASMVPAMAADPAPAPATTASLLEVVTQIFTSAVGWVQTIVGMITSTPLFLIPFMLFMVYLGVNLFNRISRAG